MTRERMSGGRTPSITNLFTVSVLALSCLSQSAVAQIGVSLCSCQPAYYEFTLNFGLTCADMDVAGSGIVDTACVLNTQGGDNVTDFAPVIVTEIQVLELDQNLQVVYQTAYEDDFYDGDIFNYTSITQTQTPLLNTTSLPRGFQMFLTGRNAQEQDLVNFYAIVYDNDCGLFPLLEVGMSAGWTIFSNLGPPPQSLCPAVPDGGPTDPPVDAPVEPPVAPPVEAPVEAPVEPPAPAPVAAPTAPEPTTSRPTPCPPIIKGQGRDRLRRKLKVGPRPPSDCPEDDGVAIQEVTSDYAPKGKESKEKSASSSTKGSPKEPKADKGPKGEKKAKKEKDPKEPKGGPKLKKEKSSKGKEPKAKESEKDPKQKKSVKKGDVYYDDDAVPKGKGMKKDHRALRQS